MGLLTGRESRTWKGKAASRAELEVTVQVGSNPVSRSQVCRREGRLSRPCEAGFFVCAERGPRRSAALLVRALAPFATAAESFLQAAHGRGAGVALGCGSRPPCNLKEPDHAP